MSARKGWRPIRSARVLVGRATAPRGRRLWWVLAFGIAAIVLWQESFTRPDAKIDASYRITAASGVHYDRNFTYFLYYLNLFPVASVAGLRCNSDTLEGCWDSAGTVADFSYAAAKNYLVKSGSNLRQDLNWTWYAGDRGKIYLFLFDAWLKGAPWNPSPRPASRLAFIVALSALFASCWWVRRPVLGASMVVLLGSNPFQLYEVHGRDNVFGLNISIAILLLAIHVPLLRRWRPDPRWVFAWPIGVGILMATLRTVRSEPVTMMLGVVAAYAFVSGLTWKRRGAMVAALLGTFWLTGTLWNHHFVTQERRSAAAIAQYGGVPFPSDIRLYHHVWHPVWCGLGDFGSKYGYVWEDTAAAAYARPILEARGVYVPTPSWIDTPDPREYLDPATKKYKLLPYDIPGYNDVIRDKVLSDIKKDPAWYAGVLVKRAGRILTMTTPLRLSWATGFVSLPAFFSLLFVPLLAVLALLRLRFLLGIALFTLPSALTALLIYSDRGITYYGVFHILGFAIVAATVIGFVRLRVEPALRKRERRSQPASTESARV